ncbi:MAG: heme-binding protein [Hyphomicrobiales bacterium]|nr:heme-binding protein [Hyphomicrobiales bacterium]
MSRLIVGIAVTLLALTSLSVAQTPPAPPPPYGLSIALDAARKMVDAAEAEAKKNNWNVVISVVDTGGHPVYLRRLDGAQTASVVIAQGKASTAVAFRRPTKALEDGLQQSSRILAVPGAMPLEGGLPIVVDGKIIGGIGVSGVLSSQDAIIAMAGIAALK